ALPPAAHELPGPREHLDAVVVGVRHVEVAVGPQRQRPRALELPRLAAGAAEGAHELAAGVELADPLHLAELADVVEAVLVLHHVADVAELARSAAGPAPDLAQLLALGRVDPEAVVVRVADDQVAVAVDAQSAGPPLAVVRRGPGAAQV